MAKPGGTGSASDLSFYEARLDRSSGRSRSPYRIKSLGGRVTDEVMMVHKPKVERDDC
jgi:hypothetical protein